MRGNEEKDGGPAFPCTDSIVTTDGMTLRDWFAGQALAGILSDNETLVMLQSVSGAKGDALSEVSARTAYDFADAMIRERAKR